jgi:hypothetical protein
MKMTLALWLGATLAPTSTDLAGMAKTDSNAKEEKLDVTFHATCK